MKEKEMRKRLDDRFNNHGALMARAVKRMRQESPGSAKTLENAGVLEKQAVGGCLHKNDCDGCSEGDD